MSKNRYERNYDKLQKIVPQIFDKDISRVKLKSDGYMDLNVEHLYTDRNERDIVSLAHYYNQNGDMMKDPDMVVRLDHKIKIVEVLTFQQDGGIPIYQEVYPDENHVRPKLKQQLNSFLEQWLENITMQGHEPYMINGEPIQDNNLNNNTIKPSDGGMDMTM